MVGKLGHRWVLWVSRLFLGGIFIVAAWPKIVDLPAFAQSIKYYDMVPLGFLPHFATLLVGLEFVVGIALIAGLWRRGSSALVSAMLVMFIVALSTAYLRGLSIDCGCFTAELSPLDAAAKRANIVNRIVMDLGMLVVAVNLLVWEWRGNYKRQPVSGEPILAVSPQSDV